MVLSGLSSNLSKLAALHQILPGLPSNEVAAQPTPPRAGCPDGRRAFGTVSEAVVTVWRRPTPRCQ